MAQKKPAALSAAGFYISTGTSSVWKLQVLAGRRSARCANLHVVHAGESSTGSILQPKRKGKLVDDNGAIHVGLDRYAKRKRARVYQIDRVLLEFNRSRLD